MITPYFADDTVRLYCGDFRELLPHVFPDTSALDLVIADPPYGETSLPWDTWPEGWPSLVPGRAMWCFGSMRMFLDRWSEFAGWRLSQDVVWEKVNGTAFATDRLRRVHEHVLHLYRGPWDDVHHEVPRVPSDSPTVKAPVVTGSRAAHIHGVLGPSTWVDDGTRQLRSVIRERSARGPASPTEKPAVLLRHLVDYGCPPGGMVVDVFAGSGSTLAAARDMGRLAVGFERSEDQCALAVRHRLGQSVLGLGLSGA